ncbi:MAG: carbohydrate kinase [Gammaproteobacteria bacterium]|nr:carbohydrate kinase [Gammaproteobacteria bacterium]
MTNRDKRIRPVIFGEVLFDHFPDGSIVLGGAPFNVAWHLQAFGQAPLFISRVGNDPLGHKIKDKMELWGMDSSGLQLDSSHPTGTVNVQISDGEPSYEIVQDCAYDFIARDAIPPLPQQGILYHGTLAIRNEHSASTLSSIKDNYCYSIFVDINLRPPWWNMQCINSALTDSHWAKLNEDELRQISPEDQSTTDVEQLAHNLLADFALEGVVITQGAKGAFALTANGDKVSAIPEMSKSVIDTVGAGDAFNSIILLGNIQRWPLSLTLRRAQQFASQVVTIRGATINNRKFYQPLIDSWELN